MPNIDPMSTMLDTDKLYALQLAIADLQEAGYFEASTALRRAEVYLAWLREE